MILVAVKIIKRVESKEILHFENKKVTK